MTRAIGTFCNNQYFPILVPFLNSLFHNDVQARIKVYNQSGLNHMLRTYLRKFVDVIDMSDRSIMTPNWFNGCLFRPAMLAQLGFDEVELFLDSDMVVLSDLEWPFQLLEGGDFVCCTEWTWGPGKINDQSAIKWQKLVGAPPPEKFDVYNGGLLGFNFNKHYDLARKWDKLCRAKVVYSKHPFNNDQMVISGILHSLRVPRRDLPRRYWMTTWERHSKPPKRLGFNAKGKARLYDAESGKPVQIYHYTGGITKIIDGAEKVVRYYHSRGESILDREVDGEQQRAWRDLWASYGSPAGIVADYMRDLGPVQVPVIYSSQFRTKLANVLGAINQEATERKLTAICLAYDYITLLGYRLADQCWMTKPLRILLGDKIEIGEKSLRWAAPADVTLSFGKPGACLWTGKSFSETGRREHLDGVDIVFA